MTKSEGQIIQELTAEGARKMNELCRQLNKVMTLTPVEIELLSSVISTLEQVGRMAKAELDKK